MKKISDIRDCKNCKNYVSINTGMFSKIQGCKKWECEFEPLKNIKITVTFDEIKRLNEEELADLIMLRLYKILELEK